MKHVLMALLLLASAPAFAKHARPHRDLSQQYQDTESQEFANEDRARDQAREASDQSLSLGFIRQYLSERGVQLVGRPVCNRNVGCSVMNFKISTGAVCEVSIFKRVVGGSGGNTCTYAQLSNVSCVTKTSRDTWVGQGRSVQLDGSSLVCRSGGDESYGDEL